MKPKPCAGCGAAAHQPGSCLDAAERRFMRGAGMMGRSVVDVRAAHARPAGSRTWSQILRDLPVRAHDDVQALQGTRSTMQSVFDRQLEPVRGQAGGAPAPYVVHGDTQTLRNIAEPYTWAMGHFHRHVSRGPSIHRTPTIRLAGRVLKRRTLGGLALKYARSAVKQRSGGAFLTNRHDARRWIRAFAPVAAVAEDALLEGRRGAAIGCLIEMVCLNDALDLCEPTRHEYQAARYATMQDVERDFDTNSREYLQARGVFDLATTNNVLVPGDRVRVSTTGAVADPDGEYVVQHADAERIRLAVPERSGKMQQMLGRLRRYPYTQAQVDRAYLDARVLTPEEVNASRWLGDRFLRTANDDHTATPPVPDEDG